MAERLVAAHSQHELACCPAGLQPLAALDQLFAWKKRGASTQVLIILLQREFPPESSSGS